MKIRNENQPKRILNKIKQRNQLRSTNPNSPNLANLNIEINHEIAEDKHKL